MSQYALFLHKKALGQNVRCIFKDTAHNGIELERLFGIKRKSYCLSPLIYFLLKIFVSKERLGIKKVIVSLLKCMNICAKIENRNYSFEPSILKANSGLTIYYGGWHHYKYLDGVENIVRSSYTFPLFKDVRNIQIQADAKNYNAVAIHIRRGDYVDKEHYHLYGRVCDLDYYQKAIRYFEVKLGNPIFYIFSNDEEWAKKAVPSNSVFINWNKGSNSWADMALMSEFRNIIIANSTFSWWAAWIGAHDKDVVSPSSLIYGDKDSDIFLPEWKKM